ncbi:hypothetical protein [Paenibacillus sp. tmac-D7]|uniref:hypothetical protein n=1 Tax=Paenibacillus sp. tmac-D7 TaxID=2591462 RepID=UPI001144D111|nr:hypothetical protein [Paenibacillus sp. tmac-D7]
MKPSINKTFILVIALFLSVIYITNAEGVTSPGSVNDPLITKSYFDENIDKKITEAIAKYTSNAGNKPDSSTPTPAATNSDLTIVELKQSQTLYGGSGTEIIVRTGKVLVTSSDESGIADVTIGKDITNGAPVELNHLLIVPREGRGIKPDPKNKQDIFVMVRGSYSILNADGTKATP